MSRPLKGVAEIEKQIIDCYERGSTSTSFLGLSPAHVELLRQSGYEVNMTEVYRDQQRWIVDWSAR